MMIDISRFIALALNSSLYRAFFAQISGRMVSLSSFILRFFYIAIRNFSKRFATLFLSPWANKYTLTSLPHQTQFFTAALNLS